MSDALLRINSLGDCCGVSDFSFACIQTDEDDSLRQKVRVLCVGTIYTKHTNDLYARKKKKTTRPKNSREINYKMKENAIYPPL